MLTRKRRRVESENETSNGRVKRVKVLESFLKCNDVARIVHEYEPRFEAKMLWMQTFERPPTPSIEVRGCAIRAAGRSCLLSTGEIPWDVDLAHWAVRVWKDWHVRMTPLDFDPYPCTIVFWNSATEETKHFEQHESRPLFAKKVVAETIIFIRKSPQRPNALRSVFWLEPTSLHAYLEGCAILPTVQAHPRCKLEPAELDQFDRGYRSGTSVAFSTDRYNMREYKVYNFATQNMRQSKRPKSDVHFVKSFVALSDDSDVIVYRATKGYSVTWSDRRTPKFLPTSHYTIVADTSIAYQNRKSEIECKSLVDWVTLWTFPIDNLNGLSGLSFLPFSNTVLAVGKHGRIRTNMDEKTFEATNGSRVIEMIAKDPFVVLISSRARRSVFEVRCFQSE